MITTVNLLYNGREVVFAMRQGELVASNPVAHIPDISRHKEEKSNYHLYRINIDGSELRQLTHGTYNNLDPCWLPDGGIAFISDRKPAYAYCYVVTSPVLYHMERDGSKQKRLSANYLMDFTPSVLTDGKLVYTRWEYVDRAACPIQSLWTINPDGTELAGFYGNRVISPGTFMDAQPIPGTNQVLATTTNHNGSCHGGIVAIDPAKGANAPEAIRNLTPEIDIYAHRVGGGPWGNGMLDRQIGGTYEKPVAINATRFLVSKGGTIQLRDFDAHVTSLLFPQDGMGFYSPMPICETVTPPVVTGNFMDHTTELPEDGSVSGAWATVYMQDVYNGTSSSNHKAHLGSRRMMPLTLDSTLKNVASRRCASCHENDIPQEFYTRVEKPEHNSFLLAPLANKAGGTQRCGKPVFLSTDDPDYQRILKTFEPIHALLKERPRADMPTYENFCEDPSI